MVQWVKLCVPNCRGLGSIPGRRTRSHIPQLRNAHATTKKILGAAIKIQCSQNKYYKQKPLFPELLELWATDCGTVYMSKAVCMYAWS